MKNIVLAAALAAILLSGCMSSRTSLNDGWEFSRDSLFKSVKVINVPHDFQIEQPWIPPLAEEKGDNKDVAANIKSRLSARGFKEMGKGWYRRWITMKGEWLKDRRVLLDFEGIMLVGDVWLNGQYIGGTDYGYVGFELDVTRLLHAGNNELVVCASTMTEQNSRWYTGGGLFRNVTLVSTPADLYFERHPLYITTHANRFVSLTAEYTNRTKAKEVRIAVKIYDPDGQLVAETTASQKRNTPGRTQEITTQKMEIANAQLWDIESPKLYKAVVQLLYEDGSVAGHHGFHPGKYHEDRGPDADRHTHPAE